MTQTTQSAIGFVSQDCPPNRLWATRESRADLAATTGPRAAPGLLAEDFRHFADVANGFVWPQAASSTAAPRSGLGMMLTDDPTRRPSGRWPRLAARGTDDDR